MDLKILTKRAIEIRNKYRDSEVKRNSKEWTNLNLMEGFVGDVGDLMKLVMAKEGLKQVENVDEQLAHELSDCLWSILVLSEKYGIDIEKSFVKTMNEIEERINSK